MTLIYDSADFDEEDDMSNFELEIDNKQLEKALRKIIIQASHADPDSYDTRKILDDILCSSIVLEALAEENVDYLKDYFLEKAAEEYAQQKDIGEEL